MVFVVIIATLLCAPFAWWFLLLRKYKCLDNIGGPKPLPIIGNAIEIGNTPQTLLRNCAKITNENGGIGKVFIAHEVRVLIAKPQLVEQILSSNVLITKSTAYDLLRPWLGVGLLTSTGKKWKSRRKMITPTFHFKILDQFLDVFNSCSNVLVQKLSNEVGKTSVDIYPYINLCSLDMICETSMGVQIYAQDGNNSQYVQAVRGYLDIFIIRTFSAIKRFDFLFKFTSLYPTFQEYLRILHKFSNDIIQRRRQEKAQQESEPTSRSDDVGIKRKVALLDMLLESEDMLSNEDIREEIDTFMFEGHDTVTSGIAFAVFCLAENPEVQDKVYEEAIEITGEGEDTNLTMQQLHNAKYLEMVLKEVQRLYPSVPAYERRIEEDCKIGEYNFPKGTILNSFAFVMHRNEEYFPDPLKFDPERFLPENCSKRHNYVYIPFSAGPRNCIGQKFAMLEMKATIMKIVKKFRILQVPNFKLDLGMAAVLKSYNGVCVRLQHRDR